MAKIIYLSSHEVLEHDEVSLFVELGHEVFSLGAYMNPTISSGGLRPEIPNSKFYPELFSLGVACSKDSIHPDLIKWADIVVIMHNSKMPGDTSEQPWLVGNWPLLKGKRIIWRSIGQSVESVEKEISIYKDEGLQIVRYSPKEKVIPGYAGDDAIIRFYKDPEHYKGWTGKNKRVVNFTQSLKGRGEHCGYETFMEATRDFDRIVYGRGNEDLGDLWGGILSEEDHLKALQENGVYFYFGTAPASYTLSLIEAMLTGIPIVAAGPAFSRHIYNLDTNEISDIIQNGVNGFVSDSVDDLKEYIKLLLTDTEVAKRIGEAGRKTAINLFGKEKIKSEWKEFLENEKHN